MGYRVSASRIPAGSNTSASAVASIARARKADTIPIATRNLRASTRKLPRIGPGRPEIFVDIKKKDLLGEYKNVDGDYRPKSLNRCQRA
ncbi:hypothetical protein [Methylocapsa aurea]|uniref:hypothetical protein n=1 Tax=Methylocapsa aurea TaxID=663610 RepID=UPI003D18CB2D